MKIAFALLIASLAQANKKAPVAQNLGYAGEGIETRFDYKQVFKHPMSGDVLITDNLVRISPSLAYKSGLLWCETVNPHKEWMVEFSFSVYGRSSVGGDGFAIWYTKDLKGSVTKPDFYGHTGNFVGAAIVFDTRLFSCLINSDVKSNRVNPFIYAYGYWLMYRIENNGAKTTKDFITYASSSTNLGACFREYRNTPSPVWGKLIYKDNTLTLDIDIRQGRRGYLKVFTYLAPIHLPTGYHFGISSSTSGSNLDDHDFHSFETYELNPAAKEKVLRPFEEEDIGKGKGFKLDEDMEKKRVLDEELAQEAAFAESNAYNAVRRLEENQFHILEALNVIETRIGATPADILTPAHQQGLEARLAETLGLLKKDLSDLRSDLTALHAATSQLKQMCESLLKGLDIKLQTNSNMMANSRESSSALGTALKIFAGFAGIALCIVVYTIVVRGQEERVKKFV